MTLTKITNEILDKLLSLIDRDKISNVNNNNNSSNDDDDNNNYSYPKIHETIDLICINCKAPRLYKVGYAEFDYTLHCFRCDKIERVVSL